MKNKITLLKTKTKKDKKQVNEIEQFMRSLLSKLQYTNNEKLIQLVESTVLLVTVMKLRVNVQNSLLSRLEFNSGDAARMRLSNCTRLDDALIRIRVVPNAEARRKSIVFAHRVVIRSCRSRLLHHPRCPVY